MGYLLWFEPAGKPGSATERVLLRRNGQLGLAEGSPGLLLEAVQHCDWAVHEADEHAPAQGYRWSKQPGKSGEWFVPEASQAYTRFLLNWRASLELEKWMDLHRRRHEHAPERPAHDDPSVRPAGLEHRELELQRCRDVQDIIAVMLADAGEPIPGWPAELDALVASTASDGAAPPHVPDFVRAIQHMREFTPAQRYADLVAGIDRYRFPEARDSDAPFWAIVSNPSRWLVPFSSHWLERHPHITCSPPPLVYYAADHWEAACIEVGWALPLGVAARRCRHIGCHVWFLRAGVQGRRRLFCRQHADLAAVSRYSRKYPELIKARRRLRALDDKRRRGKMADAEYNEQRRAIVATMDWYRSIGLAPARRRSRRSQRGGAQKGGAVAKLTGRT